MEYILTLKGTCIDFKMRKQHRKDGFSNPWGESASRRLQILECKEFGKVKSEKHEEENVMWVLQFCMASFCHGSDWLDMGS